MEVEWHRLPLQKWGVIPFGHSSGRQRSTIGDQTLNLTLRENQDSGSWLNRRQSRQPGQQNTSVPIVGFGGVRPESKLGQTYSEGAEYPIKVSQRFWHFGDIIRPKKARSTTEGSLREGRLIPAGESFVARPVPARLEPGDDRLGIVEQQLRILAVVRAKPPVSVLGDVLDGPKLLKSKSTNKREWKLR